mgnify:CR=1 FL=1
MKRISVGNNRKLVETVGAGKKGFVAVTVRAVNNSIDLISILNDSIRQDISKVIVFKSSED